MESIGVGDLVELVDFVPKKDLHQTPSVSVNFCFENLLGVPITQVVLLEFTFFSPFPPPHPVPSSGLFLNQLNTEGFQIQFGVYHFFRFQTNQGNHFQTTQDTEILHASLIQPNQTIYEEEKIQKPYQTNQFLATQEGENQPATLMQPN